MKQGLKNEIVVREYKRIVIIILAALIAQVFVYINIHLGAKDIEWLGMAEFIRLYFGGPTLKNSTDLTTVVIYFIPLCMLCSVLADGLITEFKESFTYIFTRTNKRQVYYNRIMVKVMQYVILYHVVLLAAGLLMEQPKLVITLTELKQCLGIVALSFLQCLALVTFNQMIRLLMKEQFSCIIGYIVLVFPMLTAAHCYRNQSHYMKLALLAPFNQGIYNYQTAAHWKCAIYLIVFIGVVYTVTRKRVITYEVL